MPTERYVEIEDVECIAETDQALLCAIDGEEHWIPQSQIDEDSEIHQRGDSGVLRVTRWLASQRGLV